MLLPRNTIDLPCRRAKTMPIPTNVHDLARYLQTGKWHAEESQIKRARNKKTRLSLAFILDTGIEVHPRHDIATLKPCHGTAQYKHNNSTDHSSEKLREGKARQVTAPQHTMKSEKKRHCSPMNLRKDTLQAVRKACFIDNGTQRSSKEGKARLFNTMGVNHTPQKYYSMVPTCWSSCTIYHPRVLLFLRFVNSTLCILLQFYSPQYFLKYMNSFPKSTTIFP